MTVGRVEILSVIIDFIGWSEGRVGRTCSILVILLGLESLRLIITGKYGMEAMLVCQLKL